MVAHWSVRPLQQLSINVSVVAPNLWPPSTGSYLSISGVLYTFWLVGSLCLDFLKYVNKLIVLINQYTHKEQVEDVPI